MDLRLHIGFTKPHQNHLLYLGNYEATIYNFSLHCTPKAAWLNSSPQETWGFSMHAASTVCLKTAAPPTPSGGPRRLHLSRRVFLWTSWHPCPSSSVLFRAGTSTLGPQGAPGARLLCAVCLAHRTRYSKKKRSNLEDRGGSDLLRFDDILQCFRWVVGIW